MKKGSFQWMKSLNRTIILNKIRTDGPISRAQIAKETKLTPPTVSSLVSELIEKELVIESEQGESIGGRKPTLLVINSDRFYIIGLDVGAKKIRAILIDLSGKTIDKTQTLIPKPISNEDLLTLIKRTINHLTSNHDTIEVIGIGVGMHGAVDVETGSSLFAPGLNLRDIPIKKELEAEYDVPVKVDNDVRAMAFGEYWFMEEKKDESIVTVNIGIGVGAGIVLNGKIFHGKYDLAGEIGHMTVDLKGNLCSCGNIGCWQTLISGPAIGEAARNQLERYPESLLLNMVEGDVQKIEGKTVYEAAVAGDALSKEILEGTGVYIGIGLTNLIHMLNPSKIIIGGGVANASPFILPIIKETISERGLTRQAKATPIYCSNQGAYGTAIGACALILGEIFEGDVPVVG
ncbi:ROK family transcriptional regulator [Lederbergia wuyishanensis]|uniref:Glucokinase-like ROK family protein n=1 Tax=Lederbergia wuyishanensis TaxID=1347903 RepID=A0ABU0D8Z3_9BACI|nr:ROK family transcriptional regulator [Lederbergia wuyishanensis]MCJ8007569.1 ROK family transcriptional regulator [Lederbergia wuyishanensis]MDQ0344848.1 glucokinase-like ROK family protein [Lederbergia wuyishanensis]